jgi:thiol-disulfide isomerase/thioredoxin
MKTPVVRMISLAALAVFLVSIAGCADHSGGQTDGKMAEIDAALQKGPVFVEFGNGLCSWCQLEKAVVRNLSINYTGVTFVDVDTDVNGTLAQDFYVEGVPQMDIIVKKNGDGSYTYIDSYGNATTDRYGSRLIGYLDYSELKLLLDAAVNAR